MSSSDEHPIVEATFTPAQREWIDQLLSERRSEVFTSIIRVSKEGRLGQVDAKLGWCQIINHGHQVRLVLQT